MVLPYQFGAVLILATDVAHQPTNPLGFGGIVAWIVCARRKDRSIGGWLLFYYWQVFAGAVLAAFMLTSGAPMPAFALHQVTRPHWLKRYGGYTRTRG